MLAPRAATEHEHPARTSVQEGRQWICQQVLQEELSQGQSHYRLYHRFYFPLLPCTLALEQEFRKRHQCEDTAHTQWFSWTQETLNGSHCSPLYQAATSLKPSAVSALPTLQTQSQTGSTSPPSRYWFLIQLNIHMSFFSSLLKHFSSPGMYLTSIIKL